MKILIAAPDRDLLLSLKKMFSLYGYDVTDVFDGAMVISALESDEYDLVILDHKLPGVTEGKILRLLKKSNRPSISMLYKAVDVDILTGKYAASSYITYPFDSAELRARAEAVIQKSRSDEISEYNGIKIIEGKFEIQDGEAVTNEETDILKILITGNPALNDVNDVYIKSLNCKLKKTGTKATVKYILNEGYKLVFDNE